MVRTHLTVGIRSDQLLATEDQIGAIGLCIVSDQALAIGVTAVPTPITDMESDLWFLHKVLINSMFFSTAASFQSPGSIVYEIDSKAMRKVNDDEQIVIVQEASGVSQGQVVSVGGRLMIKEA